MDNSSLTLIKKSSLTLISAALVLTGCSSDPDSPTAPETTLPRVVATSPSPAAASVATNTTITVTFSEPVKPATVTILIGGLVRGTTVVTDSIATMTLDHPLLQWLDYTAAVLAGVEDLAGNRMDSNYVWSFTTSFAPLGMEWTAQTSPTAVHLHDVVRGSQEFLAVGVGGAMVTSADGIAWTEETFQPVASQLYASFPIGDRFVVAGSPGTMLASRGPQDWTQYTLGDSIAILYDVLVAFDGIYMVGTGGATGTDGVLVRFRSESDWTMTTLGANLRPRSITSYPGGYVIVGDSGLILTSPDGANWTDESYPPDWGALHKVRWNSHSDLLIAVGSAVLTSPDGSIWTGRTPVSLTLLRDLTWTQLYAGGTNHLLYCAVGDGGTVLTSEDAITWTPRSPGVAVDLHGVARGLVPSRFVAVGSGGMILTSD